ncbi:hypothetical protein B0H67DRAFT_489085 [Lasiosphaeris hirsuta]|uniref:Uncharacterized protein n=1 Tax=Lasiosphaeris hirsuta TaxID=260670 RepID=A0AA40AEX4_9PEZI|nr:hypothetical protein B0H67DRAFT_489085 [Lasiosphaeris hirsuta]
MVGFAVIAPTFNLADQKAQTFRTMSLILMASRLTMAAQYSSIMWHVRKFKNTNLPLGLMVGLNMVTAIIYLGVAFAFQDGNSSLFSVWYIFTGVEMVFTVGFSMRWKVLSFYGTHLVNRMSLLTYIFMGEGIITVLSAVTKIVLNANSWSSATIGNVTAGISTLYIIYMIYFDWRRQLNISLVKQLSWSLLHFPFHLALKLFVLGFTQFVIWWKVFETRYNVQDQFAASLAAGEEPNFNVTTSWLINALNTTVNNVFSTYVPKYYDTYLSIDDALNDLSYIPDSFWLVTDDYMPADFNQTALNETIDTLDLGIYDLWNAVENSLFATFNINGFSSVSGFKGEVTYEVNEKAAEVNWGKFRLVFVYAYVAAGITLILMNTLFIVSRTRGWTPFNYLRKAVNYAVGLGLCLVSLVSLNDEHAAAFEGTPWPLPTLCLTFFAVLILNHLPQPPPIFFRKRGTEEAPEVGWDVVKEMGFRGKTSDEALVVTERKVM